mgnify:FL=1
MHFPPRKRERGTLPPPPDTTPLKARACGARTLVLLSRLIPAPIFHTEKDAKKEIRCAENTLRGKQTRPKIIASLRHGLRQCCFGTFCGFQHILTPNFRKHVFSHRFLPNKRCDTFPRAENDILACFRGQDSTLKKFGNFAFQDRFSKKSHFRQDWSGKCVLGHIALLTPYIEIPILKKRGPKRGPVRS